MPVPYDFVPLQPRVVRAPRAGFQGHDRFQGQSGILTCQLMAESPLFTAAGQRGAQLSFPKDASNRPVIPGSSLKGVIRAVAEAVSPSCMILSHTLLGNRGRIEASYRGKLSDELLPCGTKEPLSLCICCRLFGMVGMGRGEEAQPRSFQGKVSLSDARADSFTLGRPIWITLMQPHPDHESFYAPDRKVAGRKFYRHRPLGVISDPSQNRYNKQITPVEKGSSFSLRVDYRNLSADEEKLLLYALFLEEGLCHKVGMGKPMGLGSCRIIPQRLQTLSPAQRYQSLGAGIQEIVGDTLIAHVQQATVSYRQDRSASLEKLRQLLRFDPNDRTDYRHPSKAWFEANPSKRLNEVP